MTIVYTSETGFTARYATLLGQQCKKTVLSLEEALNTLEKGSDVVYLGWLMAGRVTGLDKAKKHFTIRAVAGVGIRPDIENMTKTICKMSAVPAEGGFYLPGGYAPDQLQGNKKKALAMVLNLLRKKISKQKTISPGEKRLLEVFECGGSFVDKQYLAPLKDYVKQL